MTRATWLLAAALLWSGCPSGAGSSGTGSSDMGRTAGDDDVTFPDEGVRERPERHPASELVARGEAALASGDPRAAFQLFEQAIQESPRDPRAHLNVGLVLELGNEYEAAERAYRAALEIDPAFPEALNNLGLLLRDVERAGEAVEVLRRAVAEDPSFGEAWLNLAMASEDAGDDASAEEAYRRAVRLRPDDGLARTNFGLLFLRRGQNDQAAIELRRALRLVGQDAAALQAIGHGLRRAGQPEPAVQALRSAIEAHGGPTPALLGELALAQRAANDTDGAKATLRQAIALDARYATAHALLGSLLAAEGQYAEAITSFETALRLEPSGPLAARTREQLEAARRAQRAR
ncbi:MAG: tetratricopeptide repeat protein [Myxococcales bacterium]|nr:tetratricopeptide repeat protein [Myxococcales bacterium]